MESESKLPEEQEAQLIHDFFELQRLETLNRRQELEVRQAEIESNERIALKSIEAQQADSLKRSEVVQHIERGKLWLIGLIASLLALVIISAMHSKHPEIALELIKVGGAVLLGYLAGIHRGKAQALERQQEQKNHH